jgi:hypothetical protein
MAIQNAAFCLRQLDFAVKPTTAVSARFADVRSSRQHFS